MFENYNVAKEDIPSDPRFGVGPSLVPIEALQKLADTGNTLMGTSHRKNSVKSLCREIQEGLVKYFDLPADYEVVLGNGGATFLFDMIGLGLVEKSSAHYTTGEFSQKWFKAHNKIPWISATEVSVEYGQGQNAKALAGHDMICCTLNETSTGVMISDLPDVDDSTLLAVDATSGAGQIQLDLSKVDLYFFSPQKIFASEGGFYICIMSPKAIARANKLMTRDTYTPEVMSWKHAIENSKKNQTYNTPAIATLFLLNEQIKVMNKLGQKSVCTQAQEKADFIYNWAESKSYLSCYVENSEFRSTAVATIDLDDKYSADDLAKRLRDQKIVMGIEAYRKLGRNQFRISLFHNITLSDLKKLTSILSKAIEGEL